MLTGPEGSLGDGRGFRLLFAANPFPERLRLGDAADACSGNGDRVCVGVCVCVCVGAGPLGP